MTELAAGAALIVSVALAVSYFVVGVRVGARQAGRALPAYRELSRVAFGGCLTPRGHEEGARKDATALFWRMVFGWPFCLLQRSVSRAAERAIESHDPEAAQRRIEQQRRRIWELERELLKDGGES